MSAQWPATMTRTTPPAPPQPTLADLRASIETSNQLLRDLIALFRPPMNEFKSGALITSTVMKFSPGVLYNISGVNNSGSTRFLQFFDMVDTIPANGSVPDLVYQVATATNFAFDLGLLGRKFDKGIVFVSSSTLATATITATADIWLNARLS